MIDDAPRSDESDVRLAAPEPFSTVLRERTKLVHREAERSGFIADLIRARATRDLYAAYLRNLVPVYAALEEHIDRLAAVPHLAAFADARLRRLPSLVADLTAIDGADWPSRPVVAEAEAYAGAVREAATAGAARLAAHAYARYLGDLSGGQILKPLLARTLGLGPDLLTVYDFVAFGDVELPKAALRRGLDLVPPAGAEAEAIVAEAIAAFRHTIALSCALAPD